MPIEEKGRIEESEIVEEKIEPFTVASYTATGSGAEDKARKYLFAWAKEQNMDLTDEDVKIFAFLIYTDRLQMYAFLILSEKIYFSYLKY